MTRWRPQLLQKLATRIAQNGQEVNTCMKGKGGDLELVVGREEEMYSFSSCEMEGWVEGLSEEYQHHKATHSKQEEP